MKTITLNCVSAEDYARICYALRHLKKECSTLTIKAHEVQK